MPMSLWANEVMEAYRKVQRALIRARKQQRGTESDEKTTVSEPQREPPTRPASSPTARPPTSPTARTIGKGDGEVRQEGDGLGDYMPVPKESEPDPGHEDWTDEQWKSWGKQRRQEWYEDDENLQRRRLPLGRAPDGELGGLARRDLGLVAVEARANLSAASRLSIVSAWEIRKRSCCRLMPTDQEDKGDAGPTGLKKIAAGVF